jgi:hypothetical protein
VCKGAALFVYEGDTGEQAKRPVGNITLSKTTELELLTLAGADRVLSGAGEPLLNGKYDADAGRRKISLSARSARKGSAAVKAAAEQREYDRIVVQMVERHPPKKQAASGVKAGGRRYSQLTRQSRAVKLEVGAGGVVSPTAVRKGTTKPSPTSPSGSSGAGAEAEKGTGQLLPWMQKKQREREAKTPATTYLLLADDETQADDWVDALTEAVDQGLESSLGKALRPGEHAAQQKRDEADEETKRRTRRRSRTSGGQAYRSALMKALHTLAEAEACRSVQLQTLRHTLVGPCAMVLGLSSHLLTVDDVKLPSSSAADAAGGTINGAAVSSPTLKQGGDGSQNSLDLVPKPDALSLVRERSFLDLDVRTGREETDSLEGCSGIKEISTVCACLRVLSVLNIQLRTGIVYLSKELERVCVVQPAASSADKAEDDERQRTYCSPSPEALCKVLRGLLSLLLSVSPFVAPYLRLVVHYHATLNAIAPNDSGGDEPDSPHHASGAASGGDSLNSFAEAVLEAQQAIDGGAAPLEAQQLENNIARREAMRQLLGSAATHLVDRAGEVSAIVRAAVAAAHEATTTGSAACAGDAAATADAAAAATAAASKKEGGGRLKFSRNSLFRTKSETKEFMGNLKKVQGVQEKDTEKDETTSANLKGVYTLLKQLQRVGGKFCADAELVARTAEQQHKVRELGDMQQMFGDQLELVSRDTLGRIAPPTRYSSLVADAYMSQRESFLSDDHGMLGTGSEGTEDVQDDAWKQRMTRAGLGLGPGVGGPGVGDHVGLDGVDLQPGVPIRQCRELLRSSTLMVVKGRDQRHMWSRAVRPFRSGTKARLRRFFLFNDLLVYGHMTLNGACVIHGSFALIGCRILNLDDPDPEYMAMQRHQTQEELSQSISALEADIKSKMQQHSTGASIGKVVALPPSQDTGRKHRGVTLKRSHSKKEDLQRSLSARRELDGAVDGDGFGMDGEGSGVLGVAYSLDDDPVESDPAIAVALQQQHKTSRIDQLSRLVRKKRGSSPGSGAETGADDAGINGADADHGSGAPPRDSEIDQQATDGAFENMVVELENPLMQLEKLRLMQEQMDLNQARQEQREEEQQARRQKQHQPWQQPPSLEMDLAQMDTVMEVTRKRSNSKAEGAAGLQRSLSARRAESSSPVKHSRAESTPVLPTDPGSPNKAANGGTDVKGGGATKSKMMWGLLREAVQDMSEDKQEEQAFREQQQQEQEQLKIEAASKRRLFVQKKHAQGHGKEGEEQGHASGDDGGAGGGASGDSVAADSAASRATQQSVTQVVRKMTVEAGSIGDFVTMLNEGKTKGSSRQRSFNTSGTGLKLNPLANANEKTGLVSDDRGRVVIDGSGGRKRSTVAAMSAMLHLNSNGGGKSKRRSTTTNDVFGSGSGGGSGSGEPSFGLEIVDSKTGRRLKAYAPTRNEQQEWLEHLTASIAQAEKVQQQRTQRQKWLMLQQQKAELLEKQQQFDEREKGKLVNEKAGSGIGRGANHDGGSTKKGRGSLTAAQQQVLGVMRQFSPGGSLHVPGVGGAGRRRTANASGLPPAAGGSSSRTSGANDSGSPPGNNISNSSSSSGGGMKRRQSVKLTIMSGDTHTKGSIVELEHLDMSTLGVLESGVDLDMGEEAEAEQHLSEISEEVEEAEEVEEVCADPDVLGITLGELNLEEPDQAIKIKGSRGKLFRVKNGKASESPPGHGRTVSTMGVPAPPSALPRSPELHGLSVSVSGRKAAEIDGREILRTGWLHVKIKEKKRMSAGSYGGMMGKSSGNPRGWNLRWVVLSPHLLSVYATCQLPEAPPPAITRGLSEGAGQMEKRKQQEKDGQHYVLVNSIVSLAAEKAEKYPFVFKVTTRAGNPAGPPSNESSPTLSDSGGGGGSGGSKRKSVSAFFKRKSVASPEAVAAAGLAAERERSDIQAVATALESGRIIDSGDPQAIDAAVANAAAAEEAQHRRHGRGSIGIRRFSAGTVTSAAKAVIYFYSTSQR